MADDVRMEIEGLNQFLRMVSRAGKDVSKEVRLASKSIAEDVAGDARRRARRASRQLAAVAPTIRAVSDRVPKIRVGGARKVTSSARASDIYFGADFGAHPQNYPQFPPVKKGGRSIYPAIEANRRNAADQWLDAVEGIFMDRQMLDVRRPR